MINDQINGLHISAMWIIGLFGVPSDNKFILFSNNPKYVRSFTTRSNLKFLEKPKAVEFRRIIFSKVNSLFNIKFSLLTLALIFCEDLSQILHP